jgi:hypothetical protein
LNALEIQGAPVLVGVRKGTVVWSMSGVLNDPKALASLIRSWVQAPAPPVVPAP